ncbi:hypothetical protein [Halomonas sp. MS1]|nr:hypothetical protein [Halomonas sp. MS1]UTD57613.1 hypothetical protein NF683_10555 [Halomonas sp. MS1]
MTLDDILNKYLDVCVSISDGYSISLNENSFTNVSAAAKKIENMCDTLLKYKDITFDDSEIGRDWISRVYKETPSGTSEEMIRRKLGTILGFVKLCILDGLSSSYRFDSELESLNKDVDKVLSGQNNEEFTKNFNRLIVEYLHFFNRMFSEIRIENEIKTEINNIFEKDFHNIKQESIDISSSLEQAKADLSTLKSDLGMTSLLKDLDKYSGDISSKLTELGREGSKLKRSVIISPVIVMLAAIIFNPAWQFYTAFTILMVILGALLRDNIKKIGWYEEMLSKIDNKMAMVLFHRNNTVNLSNDEKQGANAEFLKLIYSPIEKKDWDFPDFSSSISKIIKEINSK